MRSEVLPEPLGPRRRIEGKVVSPLALKTTEWRKIGIVKTRSSAIIRPTGEGLIRACAQSCNVDIFAGLCDVVKCCIAKAVEIPCKAGPDRKIARLRTLVQLCVVSEAE